MAKRIKKLSKKSLPKAKPEEVQTEKVKKTRIRVVGIGGGGGNIVSEIASGIKKATFAVANTDTKALRVVSRKVIRFQFGDGLCHGLGTGMNAELGEMAAQNEKEKIKKLLESQDLLIIVASLGGGVGSGATPVFAKISRSLGNLTLGIFTLPFEFEGEEKMAIALSALEKLKTRVNAFLVIPNERIFQIIDKKTPLKVALSTINRMLSESLEGLIEMIYEPGLINIDFADLKTILAGYGKLSYLNTVKVQKKEGAAQEIVKKVLNNPLYPYSVRGARGVLLNISGERDLQLAEVNQISKTISELANSEARIIFGVFQNKRYSDVLQATLLATGCQMRIFPKKSKLKRTKKKVVTNALPVEEKSPKKKNLSTGQEKKVKKIKKSKPRKTPKESLRLPTGQVKIGVPKKTNEEAEDQPAAETEKIRKNALQIKKEAEAVEQELLEKEKIWETPAFLRRHKLL